MTHLEPDKAQRTRETSGQHTLRWLAITAGICMVVFLLMDMPAFGVGAALVMFALGGAYLVADIRQRATRRRG